METSARPRTLVLSIRSVHTDAVMVGPKHQLLGSPVRITTPGDARGLDVLWPQLEPIGDFDRTSVILDRAWPQQSVIEELQRQTGRLVRCASPAQLQARLLQGTGVELVLSLDPAFDALLSVDGVIVPGFALGRHPFRKGRSYAEYLAPRALARKGARAWQRRLARVVRTLVDVYHPAALHIRVPVDVELDEDALAPAHIVQSSDDLHAALALWGDAGPLSASRAG